MKTKFCVILLFFLWAVPCFAQYIDTAWVRRYNGPADSTDYGRAIAVDDSGNVYVTGYSAGIGTGNDYATIKYHPNGDTAWKRLYDGEANSTDGVCAMAVDDSRNVYVTGASYVRETDQDYATIKYDSSGKELWVSIYHHEYGESARDIALDGSGSVYVTGASSQDSIPPYYWPDYATIKYYPNGDTDWVRRYNGPGNAYDYAHAVAVDDSGYVYVTGLSMSTQGWPSTDYATIKYHPNGDTAWVRRYNGPGNDKDVPNDIVVDGSGNVYVTGASYYVSETGADYATIKYYLNGDTAWVRRYNGPGNYTDSPEALALDGYGNIYVTGKSFGGSSHFDFATIKYDSSGNELWIRRYNGPKDTTDYARAIAIDYLGNTYVTGATDGSETYLEGADYVTIKYEPDGDIAWVRRYNGPGDSTDYAVAIAADGSGNVYVTGYSYGSGTDYDWATIKYVQFLCGDANGDWKVDISDAVYLILYLFKSGNPPDCPPYPYTTCADANGNGDVTITDVVYLINYLLKGGTPPIC